VYINLLHGKKGESSTPDNSAAWPDRPSWE
jgi:hypothetical protein